MYILVCVCVRSVVRQHSAAPSSPTLPVSSAGGLGVLVNVDRVAEKLESQGHHGVRVRGLTDSGWVLERKQYKFGDCLDVLSCGPIDSARMAVRLDRS